MTDYTDEMHAVMLDRLNRLAVILGGDHYIKHRDGDVPVLLYDGYEIAADPTSDLYDVWRNEHPVRLGLAASKIAAGLEDALDDDSEVDDSAAALRRHERMKPLKTRILQHLRNVADGGDGWEPWPDLVENVDGRRLAEISPVNGRIRQAALALSGDGLIQIRLGKRTVFDAVRLLPAGYTDD